MLITPNDASPSTEDESVTELPIVYRALATRQLALNAPEIPVSEVVPFVEILLAGLPAPPRLKVVCAWCEIVISGRAPGESWHVPCFDQAVA